MAAQAEPWSVLSPLLPPVLGQESQDLPSGAPWAISAQGRRGLGLYFWETSQYGMRWAFCRPSVFFLGAHGEDVTPWAAGDSCSTVGRVFLGSRGCLLAAVSRPRHAARYRDLYSGGGSPKEAPLCGQSWAVPEGVTRRRAQGWEACCPGLTSRCTGQDKSFSPTPPVGGTNRSPISELS